MKRLNKIQLYNRINALFSQCTLTVCIEVLIGLLHNCARQVPATEIKLAQAFVALLKPVVDHLQAIAAQTPAADIGVVEGEVDPTLVTEDSMRG